MDEPLYYAWERYNDLLFRFPQHNLNNHQKVQIFYIGLDIPTRIRVDSKGFIPLMTPAQALKSIQVMADHSPNCCKICKGAHLTQECPLKKEDKAVDQSKYIGSLEETIIKYCDESIKKQAANDEWIKKFIENTDLNLRALNTTIMNLQVKADQLTQMVLTNAGERVEEEKKNCKKDMKEPIPRDLIIFQPYEDEEDMDDGWDITLKDVERLRKILTTAIHTLYNLELVVQPYMPRGPVRNEVKVIREEELEYDIPLRNGMMQSLTPQIVLTTPPDDDYIASVTNPILEKHLN
ncbi:hypothetical protein Tco_0643937 [Tanacetum coccineum]